MVHTLSDTRASALEGEHSPRLAALIHDQFGFVWRLLRRLGVSELEVDAAAEEVFEAAAQRISDIRIGSERSFSFSTTLHVAARNGRATGERGEREFPDGAPALEDLDPEQQARVILDGLLQQMPLELRVVFVLSAIEQLSADEVAIIVGIPLATVTSRLADAEEQFEGHVHGESEWAQSLLSAARQEQPSPAVLARALAAAGIHSSALRSQASFAKQSSAASSARSGLHSPWTMATKWLLMGLFLGLLLALAAEAVTDAGKRAAPLGSPRLGP